MIKAARFFFTYLCVPQTSPKAFRNTQEMAVNLQSEIERQPLPPVGYCILIVGKFLATLHICSPFFSIRSLNMCHALVASGPIYIVLIIMEFRHGCETWLHSLMEGHNFKWS
jgi:hypothetical protein